MLAALILTVFKVREVEISCVHTHAHNASLLGSRPLNSAVNFTLLGFGFFIFVLMGNCFLLQPRVLVNLHFSSREMPAFWGLLVVKGSIS